MHIFLHYLSKEELILDPPHREGMTQKRHSCKNISTWQVKCPISPKIALSRYSIYNKESCYQDSTSLENRDEYFFYEIEKCQQRYDTWESMAD